jgi:hypothetical protein
MIFVKKRRLVTSRWREIHMDGKPPSPSLRARNMLCPQAGRSTYGIFSYIKIWNITEEYSSLVV